MLSVTGRSMQPTLNPDPANGERLERDVVLLNRWPAVKTSAGAPSWKVGDIVTLTSPTDPNSTVIKRIIGLPGALVESRGPAPSLGPSSTASRVERVVRVPQGNCWVEGDEAYHTRDSNDYGPVPMGLLRARVECIIWPPRRFGKVPEREAEWERRVVHPRKDFRG